MATNENGYSTDKRYFELEVGDHLPDVFHPENADCVPDGIVGSTIVRFGAAPTTAEVEGGGLIIDFIPKMSSSVRRIVFSFTELGMSIKYFGDGPSPVL